MRVLSVLLFIAIAVVGFQESLVPVDADENNAVSPAAHPTFFTPAIEGHGKVIDPAGLAQRPEAAAKIVFEVSAFPGTAAIPPGLNRVARYLNLAAAANTAPADQKIAVVFHGPATRAALIDEAYEGGRNPALPLLRRLQELGVDLYVCTQALAKHNFALESVASPVTPAAAAMSVSVNLQMQGYAYLPD